MTQYEFNKMGYGSLPKMSKSRIRANTDELAKWLDKTEGEYWLLLNNESHYYTFYVWHDCTSMAFAEDVVSLVRDLGTLKSIEPNSTKDAYEFWITDMAGETRMYLLFPYDKGVIVI